MGGPLQSDVGWHRALSPDLLPLYRAEPGKGGYGQNPGRATTSMRTEHTTVWHRHILYTTDWEGAAKRSAQRIKGCLTWALKSRCSGISENRLTRVGPRATTAFGSRSNSWPSGRRRPGREAVTSVQRISQKSPPSIESDPIGRPSHAPPERDDWPVNGQIPLTYEPPPAIARSQALTRGPICLESGGSQGNCARSRRGGPSQALRGLATGDWAWLRVVQVVPAWRGATFRNRWPPIGLRRLKANSYPWYRYSLIVQFPPENEADIKRWLIEEAVTAMPAVVSETIENRSVLYRLSVQQPKFTFGDKVVMLGSS